MDWLRVNELSFRYAGSNRRALEGVSFSLRRGELAVLQGETGSGKSTLLRLLKRELAPRGDLEGEIRFRGRPTEAMTDREAARAIGFVAQRPEEQIVTDRVWHEMAFGLENLGMAPDEMRLRIAETVAFFGMEGWFDARTDDLSGGQKQLLNLAAVTAMRPELLLMDEPTARLDPIAAAELTQAVIRLNRETGMTVLMSEHRTEEILPAADRLIVLRAGSTVMDGRPRELCGQPEGDLGEAASLPAAARLYLACPTGEACPLSVAEGRQWLAEQLREREAAEGGTARDAEPPTEAAGARERPEARETGDAALEMREVRFRFGREAPDVLRGAGLTVRRGEIFCLLGGNGSGKTTALRAAAGLIRPYGGEIRVFGKKLSSYRKGELYDHCVAMLPQDVQTMLSRDTVAEELGDAGYTEAEGFPFGLEKHRERHPFDLSGGEQQLLALARVLATKPRLLLLDEPTNGLDLQWKRRIRDILRALRAQGMTLLMVSHDTDFAAETADRCGMLFQGEVIAAGAPRVFFARNSFYAPAICRMTRGLIPGCLTVEEAAEYLKGKRER